jgi:acyl-CoA synthetase (AMP-forming)/AMP-acid ligase II
VQVRRRGQICDEGEIGRVFLRGPGVMRGYLNRPEATAAVLRDGWLDSGDEGFLWQRELYLTGRAKDLIIVRGRNHDPAVIEQTLDGIAGLRRGCAVAFALPGEASEAVALIAETSGEVGEATLLAMRQAVRRGVGLDPAVVELVAAGSLPRTSSGKIRRQEAARRWAEGSLTAPSEPGILRLLAASFAGRRKMRQR